MAIRETSDSVKRKGKRRAFCRMRNHKSFDLFNIVRKSKIKKISVISGVGVREYYRKLGYELEGSYMVKELAS